MSADKILVLDKGQVVAQGKHNELMENEPIYAEIYNSQILAYEQAHAAGHVDEDVQPADRQPATALEHGQQDRETTLVEDLKDVGPLAAGGGWLAVVDGVQRRLFIHRDGMLRGEPSFDELKLQNPQGLAIVNDALYVADGAGRRVAVFRLKP